MLSALRSAFVAQRRTSNFRLLFKSTQCRTNKNLYGESLLFKSIQIRTYNKLYGESWNSFKCLQKLETSAKITRANFHTTRRLHIHPVLALILRPIVNVAAFVFGRLFKRWWARQTPEQRELYKRWFASKRGVFFGLFGVFVSGLVIYYVEHLESNPLNHRKRFILLNKEQQDTLAKLTYEMHLEEHHNNLVSVNHPAYRRIAKVTNNMLQSNIDIPFIKDHEWTLDVVNADTKNAYVLAGGHIFVFLGTLNMVENDDQLAIIISHEMAHVLLQHTVEQISRSVIIDLLLALPLAIIWATFPDVLAFVLQYLGKAALGVFLSLPYNRRLEKEADEVGLDLAAKACVDVREAVVFWGTMKAIVDMGIEPGQLPWLSTHPENEEREKSLNARIPEALKLRLQSGCTGVPRNDPRSQFKQRSVKEQKALFEARGYTTNVIP